ncbi:MAG: response regulator [Spirochaetes bacterium]|nr:response regulator [Spirochaetota bacterium]MBN2769335.1 response regulator [Spirochaetota bacterium]
MSETAKKKILLVEDVMTNRFLLESFLTDYDCVSVGNGDEMYVELEKGKPDLILMDIGLPGENGLDLTKQLARNPEFGDIPVIFLTSHSDKREIIEAAKAGGHDYILKPADDSILSARIEMALARHKKNK